MTVLGVCLDAGQDAEGFRLSCGRFLSHDP
jgi:hypothetical protein